MPKSVLVTGCSVGGIGYALARSFAGAGLTVFATAREIQKMGDLKQQIPQINLIQLDVTSSDDIEAAVATVSQATGGSLDYLVNNSGQLYVMPILDMDMAKAKETFDVNFWGPIRLIRAFQELLIKAKGTIATIGSTSGIITPPYFSVYGASKAAIHTLNSSLRAELEMLDVRVITFVTGAVKTEIMNHGQNTRLPSGTKYERIREPIEEIIAGTAFQSLRPMNVEIFAETIVHDMRKGKSGEIWRGSHARTTRWLLRGLPESIRIPLLFRKFYPKASTSLQ